MTLEGEFQSALEGLSPIVAHGHTLTHGRQVADQNTAHQCIGDRGFSVSSAAQRQRSGNMLAPTCVSGLQGSDTVLALLSSDGSASMFSKDGVFLTVVSTVRCKGIPRNHQRESWTLSEQESPSPATTGRDTVSTRSPSLHTEIKARCGRRNCSE